MANQHLKDNTLIERYLLKQLKDDELLEFRGAMMFDEELRKKVFQEKQLFNTLQTLSQSPEFALTVPRTKTLSFTRKWLLSAAIALSGLVGFFTYQQVNKSQPSKDIMPVNQPTAQTKSSKTEGAILTPFEETKETVSPEPETTTEIEQSNKQNEQSSEQLPLKPSVNIPIISEPVTPPAQPNNIIKNDDEQTTEEMPFAAVSPTKSDDVIKIDETEFVMGVSNTIAAADVTIEDLESLYSTHPYLEEYTDSAVRSSKGASEEVALSTDFKDNTILTQEMQQGVQLQFVITAQTLKSVSEIGTYTIKVFSNRLEDYIENKALLEKEITFSDSTTIDFKQDLSLVEGLYYFTIENTEDMKYTGKFYVTK